MTIDLEIDEYLFCHHLQTPICTEHTSNVFNFLNKFSKDLIFLANWFHTPMFIGLRRLLMPQRAEDLGVSQWLVLRQSPSILAQKGAWGYITNW